MRPVLGRKLWDGNQITDVVPVGNTILLPFIMLLICMAKYHRVCDPNLGHPVLSFSFQLTPQVNSSTTDDKCTCQSTLAACYQLVHSGR